VVTSFPSHRYRRLCPSTDNLTRFRLKDWCSDLETGDWIYAAQNISERRREEQDNRLTQLN
jgi:hypothetical protein